MRVARASPFDAAGDLAGTLDLGSPKFIDDQYGWYARLRDRSPVHRVRISVLKLYAVTRYEDCAALLSDPRLLRNRATATGGRRYPFPIPRALRPLTESMIQEDDPNHRRLRELVRRAFRPQAIARLSAQIDDYANELLDSLADAGPVDLQARYALPIPIRLISGMLGLPESAAVRLKSTLATVTASFSGWRIVRTLFRDMPRAVQFVRELVDEKRKHPGDDILSGLIEAEASGDRLTEDEIVGTVFLLIVAGFETTVHLITNGVVALLDHPEQLERLRRDPTLIDSAVEEILRFRGPVQSTKPGFASVDLTLHGVTIPRGKPILPLIAAANHDPRAFDQPERFDIARAPNRHLAFGHGVHYCLGAHLARAETRSALINLVRRFPDLRLVVPRTDLRLERVPGWHRYAGLPVTLR